MLRSTSIFRISHRVSAGKESLLLLFRSTASGVSGADSGDDTTTSRCNSGILFQADSAIKRYIVTNLSCILIKLTKLFAPRLYLFEERSDVRFRGLPNLS